MLGGLPAGRLHDDVHAVFTVEVLAQPQAVTQGAHHRGDGGPVPAHFGNARVVGANANLGLRQFGWREYLHVGAGELLHQLGLAFSCCRHEPGLVGRLHVHGDAAAAAEAAKQVALGSKATEIGNVDQDLIAHHLLEVFHLGLIQHAGADGAAVAPDPDVVVLQRRLFLAFHVRIEALYQRGSNFSLGGFPVGARWQLQERIHRIALHRRQVIELREQGPGNHQRAGNQGADDGAAAHRCATGAHQEAGQF